jgi:diaminohydroxyphosphoribosylaminopyrimidine deaminase/5-amino-6-(5-phosphoribosylamino)uracil reductase
MFSDEYFMKRAIRLAKKGAYKTSPNPMVGAVLVKDGKIISEGYHKKAGLPHAEVVAMMKSPYPVKGSTLYVTLEPCCHRNKRTLPCTDTIISSGIKRVVIAMRDPNPAVSGKGIELLKKHGIEVKEGILEAEAKKLNEFYIKYIMTKMPFVILKIAMTLDGKIATSNGESKWITSEESRKVVHKLRSKVDAILTAYGTVIKDNPSLTARIKGGRNPIRVVIDPELKIPFDYNIYNTPPKTISIVKEEFFTDEKKTILSNKGIEIITYNSEKVDLNWLMKELGKRGIISLMIEGGSSLNAYAIQHNIVDKLLIFIAPKIIGGKKSYPCIGGDFYRRLNEAYELEELSIKKINKDILIEGYIKRD